MKTNINRVVIHGPLLVHYHFKMPDEELLGEQSHEEIVITGLMEY